MGQLKCIALSTIRENPVALRTVDRDSEAYLGLVDSIKTKGFIGAISVREREELDASGKPTNILFYELVDGLHRYCAAKDAGLTEINVDIVNLNDDEVLEAQLMANIHKIETKPAEYSQQLRRILVRNPLMTEAQLATKLCKSPAWIADRLSLNKIDNQTIKNLIDEGRIPLANAYALAKIPSNEMTDWIDRAMTLPPNEFVPQITARAKEIRESKRQGRDAKPAEFIPVPYCQKMSVLKDEIEKGKTVKALIRQLNITDPIEAALMAVKWVLHLDPLSIESDKNKMEEQKKAREAEKAKRKAERDQKKSEEAAKKAAEASDPVSKMLGV